MLERIEIVNLENRIRSKMGVSNIYLPDEDINYPDVVDVAYGNVRSMVPDDFVYPGLPDGNLDGEPEEDGNNGEEGIVLPSSLEEVYFETAVILEACIILCPSMAARLPKKEAGAHASHELYVNWDKKKEDFIEERNGILGQLMELIDPLHLSPTLPSFTVTYPKRGW